MEHFRRFGLAAGIRDLGLPWDHPLDVAYFTRLSAYEIARFKVLSKQDRLARSKLTPRTDQMPEPMHRINQMYMEQFLLERARNCPNITLRFGFEVESFGQDDTGVTLTARQTQTSNTEVWRGQYLVGCDGGRSTIRRKLGIKFGNDDALTDVFFVGQVTSIYMRIPSIEQFVGHRRAWTIADRVRATESLFAKALKSLLQQNLPTADIGHSPDYLIGGGGQRVGRISVA